MERNSVIAEQFRKMLEEDLHETVNFKKLFKQADSLEAELLKRIGSDKELKEQYFNTAEAMLESNIEYEIMCFCEGVRAGFKLCMDIFEIL